MKMTERVLMVGKRQSRAKRWAMICLAAVLGLSAPSPASAQERDAAAEPAKADALITGGLDADGRLRMVVNRSAVLSTSRPIARVNVSQPDVLADNQLTETSMLLTAKRPGSTQVIVWDRQERSQVVDVIVQTDTEALAALYKEAFPDARIDVAMSGTAVVLKGRVPSLQTAEQAVAIATASGVQPVNLLEVSGGQQVMLQVKFAEVSRSATTALGVNFGYNDGRTFGGSNIGQINPLGLTDRAGSGGGVVPTLMSPSAAVTLFGTASVGETSLAYFIQALRQNNLLRVLAEPNLIATSGQEASFLAGGEFPIPVTQSTGGGTSIGIEYREFGVKLNFVPMVLGNGRIRLKVAPEVSDLDFSSAVRISGFVVPGLTTRKLQTTIELAEGQTFAVAGLLNHNMTSSRDVTPVLGDLPVVGALFRSVRYQRKETELVVLVTPRLVAAMNPAQVPEAPGQRWRHPTENDLFLKTDLGGPEAAKPARMPTAQETVRFHGEYGFVPAAPTE